MSDWARPNSSLDSRSNDSTMSVEPRGTLPDATALVNAASAPWAAFLPLKAETPRSRRLRLSSKTRSFRSQYACVASNCRRNESPRTCSARENRIYENATLWFPWSANVRTFCTMMVSSLHAVDRSISPEVLSPWYYKTT
jgi:hypothetical protein